MALFKISKGSKTNLSKQKAVEGYCWFTPEDGRFYIDTATSDTPVIGTNRICLNAYSATYDEAGNKIDTTYMKAKDIIGNISVSNNSSIILYDGTGKVIKEETIPSASEVEPGLMEAADKIKLNGLKKVFYGRCTTSSSTAVKELTVDNDFVLEEGVQLIVLFTLDNTTTTPALNVNDTGARPIRKGNVAAGQWIGNSIVYLVFDGYFWRQSYWNDTVQDIAIPVCSSNAATAAKTATCVSLDLTYNKYFPVVMKASNTAKKVLTLNINSTGAHDIYINGQPSSTTNYTLPKGLYFVYYDGQHFQFRTDGQLPGLDTSSDKDYLPLSAGADYPLTGPLGLTLNQGYGTTIPTTGFDGQLFFLTTDEEEQTLIRCDYTTTSKTSAIAFPTDIANNFSEDFILKVYSNGLLLTEGTNYSINTANDGITLNSYTCDIGDIYTFELMAKNVKGLDASVYATKEYLETRLGNFDITASYLPLSGGTMTGSIDLNKNNITNGGTIKANKVYGAVWNDYAEYREADTTEPGVVVCENGNDTMSISNRRMQPAAAIVSDTFGFTIGETDKAKTPIAVSGRVLAKPYEPIEDFRKAIGKPVCAGPNGTVSIMTDEEYATKGYCAIGIVSAVPAYETWHNGVAVNGRIWIKVG